MTMQDPLLHVPYVSEVRFETLYFEKHAFGFEPDTDMLFKDYPPDAQVSILTGLVKVELDSRRKPPPKEKWLLRPFRSLIVSNNQRHLIRTSVLRRAIDDIQQGSLGQIWEEDAEG